MDQFFDKKSSKRDRLQALENIGDLRLVLERLLEVAVKDPVNALSVAQLLVNMDVREADLDQFTASMIEFAKISIQLKPLETMKLLTVLLRRYAAVDRELAEMLAAFVNQDTLTFECRYMCALCWTLKMRDNSEEIVGILDSISADISIGDAIWLRGVIAGSSQKSLLAVISSNKPQLLVRTMLSKNKDKITTTMMAESISKLSSSLSDLVASNREGVIMFLKSWLPDALEAFLLCWDFAGIAKIFHGAFVSLVGVVTQCSLEVYLCETFSKQNHCVGDSKATLGMWMVLVANLPTELVVKRSRELFSECHTAIRNESLIGRASDFLIILVDKTKGNIEESEWLDLFLPSIAEGLLTNDLKLRELVNKTILGRVLKLCNKIPTSEQAFPALFGLLSQSSSTPEDDKLYAQIVVMKHAKALGASFQCEEQTLVSALHHFSERIQAEALSALCVGRHANSPLSEQEMRLTLDGIYDWFMITDPQFRAALVYEVRKLFERVRAAMFTLQRKHLQTVQHLAKLGLSHQDEEDLQTLNSFEAHRVFLECFLTSVPQLYHDDGSRVFTTMMLLISEIFGATGHPDHVPMQFGFDSSHGRIPFPFAVTVANEERWKKIAMCLRSKSDSVRKDAATILRSWPSPSFEILDSMMASALSWASSNRPHEVEAGALIISIILDVKDTSKDGSALTQFIVESLSSLKVQVTNAETNLAQSIVQSSMFTNILLIRKLLSDLVRYSSPTVDSLLLDAVNCCVRACRAVLPIVSDQAPEGSTENLFMVEDSMDYTPISESTTVSVSHKSALLSSSCWRTIKESCEMIALMVAKSDFKLVLDNAGNIIELVRTLLSSIKHMGAISSVEPAWQAVCKRLLESKDKLAWTTVSNCLLQDIKHASICDIGVTRRSAGLPLSIVTILHAEVNAQLSSYVNFPFDELRSVEDFTLRITGRPLLSHAILTLFEIANQPVTQEDVEKNRSDLPQVHALNILRLLFRDPVISTEIRMWECHGFILAMDSFSSKCWAIRNCGVMLFSVMVGRVFGVKTFNDPSVAVRYSAVGLQKQFPELFCYLIYLVERQSLDMMEIDRALYPALSILVKLKGPEELTSNSSAIVEALQRLTAHPDLKCRIAAANAILNFVLPEQDVMTAHALQLFSQIADKTSRSRNKLHGLLLQIASMFRRFSIPTCAFRDTECEMGANPLFLTRDLPVTVFFCSDNLDAVAFEKITIEYRDSCPMITSEALKILRNYAPPRYDKADISQCSNKPFDSIAAKETALYILCRTYCSEAEVLELLDDSMCDEVKIAVVGYLEFDSTLLSNAVIRLLSDLVNSLLKRPAEHTIIANVTLRLLASTGNMNCVQMDTIMTLVATQEKIPLSLRCQSMEASGALFIDKTAIETNMDDWLSVLTKWSHPDSDTAKRYSALAALRNLFQALDALGGHRALCFKHFCPILVIAVAKHLFQDDEENLRYEAVEILGPFIWQPGHSALSPLRAARKIYLEAAQRVSSVEDETILLSILTETVDASVHHERDGNVIFQHEPANVYRDPQFESRILEVVKRTISY